MFPEELWSHAFFSEMRRTKVLALQLDLGQNLDCGCGQSAWNLEYDAFLTELRKHKFPAHHSCAGCGLRSGVLEDNIHLLSSLAFPRSVPHYRARYRGMRKEFPYACRHGIMKLLKIETGLYKMGGGRISPIWREFCYWELGFGFVPYKSIEELTTEVEGWLCTPLDLGGPLGPGLYGRLLEQEVHRFLRTEWKQPVDPPSLEEWVRTGKWMEGKSGTGGIKITRLAET